MFHSALGQTTGFLGLADRLRAAGHTVHTPDLYEGRTFTSLKDGVTHAEEVGFDALIERGRASADGLPTELVYAGLSLGVMPAQLLTQTRPGARGAVLLHAAVPLSELGGSWPEGVPGQIHTMDGDSWGDADVAREIAASVPSVEAFLYPGDRHLFTDESAPDYDASAAHQVVDRVLDFLDRVA